MKSREKKGRSDKKSLGAFLKVVVLPYRKIIDEKAKAEIKAYFVSEIMEKMDSHIKNQFGNELVEEMIKYVMGLLYTYEEIDFLGLRLAFKTQFDPRTLKKSVDAQEILKKILRAEQNIHPFLKDDIENKKERR